MTSTTPKQQKQEENNEEHDVMEDEEIRSINYKVYNKMHDVVESFAGTSLGQFVTQKLDRILQLIEDTAKWSLPQNHDKRESNAPLNRPLPWIPFIAMILVLRMIRLSLSIGSLLIGNGPLVPGDIVYFIQTRRRKLRALRIVGKRIIHEKEQVNNRKYQNSLISKLRSLLSVIICKSRQSQRINRNFVDRKKTVEETKNSDVKQSGKYTSKQWYSGNASDEDLTIDELITKYGNSSNDSDSDFIPPPNDVLKENVSSESSSESSDNEYRNTTEASKQTSNLKSAKTIANGNQDSFNLTESQGNDSNIILKENGKDFMKNPSKSIPKPHTQGAVPIPIEEIKQEPTDYEQINSNELLIKSPHSELVNPVECSEQQATIAQANEHNQVLDAGKVNAQESSSSDKEINGSESLSYTNSKSEIFLTPATSTEDLFFSPVGSPKLSESSGFQSEPNWTTSNAERSFNERAAVGQVEDRCENKDQSNVKSTPNLLDHQQIKQNSRYYGKHNKNKFRGKPR